MKKITRANFLVLLSGIVVIATCFLHPVPQNPAYHQFADQRMFLGIPNFCNVISSIPFLLVGLLGLRAIKIGDIQGGLAELKSLYRILFIGAGCIAIGSGFYHWVPSNQTLAWDRLPMAVEFMAFLCVIVGERISARAGLRILLPLLLAGVCSVLYWYYSEMKGEGDLRFYALVQFLPLLIIPLILLLYPAKLVPDSYLWAVLGFYGLSKAVEYWDSSIMNALGVVSGHSIKHILAALGAYCFLLALQHRHAVGES